MWIFLCVDCLRFLLTMTKSKRPKRAAAKKKSEPEEYVVEKVTDRKIVNGMLFAPCMMT